MALIGRITNNLFNRVRCFIKCNANYSITSSTNKNVLQTAIMEANSLVGYSAKNILNELLNAEEIKSDIVRVSLESNTILHRAIDNNFKTSPCIGLILMLLSKMFTKDTENQNGLLTKQRLLADIAEMVKLNYVVHKTVFNVEDRNCTKENDKHNLITILFGDYILTKVLQNSLAISNNKIHELIACAIRDVAATEFIGPRNARNEPLPVKPKNYQTKFSIDITDEFDMEKLENVDEFLGYAKSEWIIRNMFNGAGLLAKMCKCCLYLLEQSNDMQKLAYNFGKHVALCWQARIEKEYFENECNMDDFNFTNAPILFHLEYDPKFYLKIIKNSDSMDKVFFCSIKDYVLRGPGLNKTELLKKEHKEEALKLLSAFPDSDEKNAMNKIVSVL